MKTETKRRQTTNDNYWVTLEDGSRKDLACSVATKIFDDINTIQQIWYNPMMQTYSVRFLNKDGERWNRMFAEELLGEYGI